MSSQLLNCGLYILDNSKVSLSSFSKFLGDSKKNDELGKNQTFDSDEIVFSKRTDSLTHSQDQYYQDLFYRVLKIGTELECARPRKVNSNELRSDIEKLLRPSNDLENLGDLGDFDVVKEHCGVEVQVIGRHPHWNALLNQYREIISILLAKSVRIRPTCGLHFQTKN